MNFFEFLKICFLLAFIVACIAVIITVTSYSVSTADNLVAGMIAAVLFNIFPALLGYGCIRGIIDVVQRG